MSATTSGTELPSLVKELEAVAEDARRTFGNLSPEQVNWQPSAESWSVGQCFDHLIKTNERFCAMLEAVGRGEHRSRAWERLSPLSGFFGKMVLKAVAPESARKFKAPSSTRPASSDVDPRVVGRFVEQQGRLAGLMRAAGKVDMKKTKVTSPFAGFVTYSLLDACRITVAHERRHFEQARRVTESANFPRHAPAA
ncbi:MAG TPA: DinB family protein [Pyrinomonadaceae bacterium]|nr:DinB family protein [Pyrinomonadaceae bacterium]